MTIDTALLDAALAYARAGLPVFPCKLDKTPHIKDWGNAASAVESQIREWWKRWPDASIGMLTGYLTGRLVIDSDPRHHGDKSLGIMEELHGPLPDTLEVRTGGGGRHLYFQLRGLNIHNSAGDLAPGVDVRGVGGYVVLPPSPHPSGNRYEWVNENPISDLPEWLEKWLLELKPAPSLGTNGAGKKIATGKRNNWLTKRAGGYRRHGDTPEVIFQKLMMDNAERCEPPMSEREVRTIANSVARYAPAEEPSRPSKANIPQDPFPSSTPPPSSPEQPEQEDVPGRLPIVEVANAERLVARYGEEIRYASDRKVWVAWNGTHWDVNDEMGLSRRMQDVARSIYSEAANSPAEELRKALASWARKSESHSVQSGSIAEARNKVEVRRFGKVFDTHPHLLNVRNCTHDLLTGESHPHSRLDFLTKIVETNYQLGAECPQFSKFLAETFHGSVPLMDYAMRLAGYFLSGLTGEQKWWIFCGPTASGKSTFLKILHGLLGPYGLALPDGYFLLSKNQSTDFVTANLQGIRLASCIETNDGRRLDVAKIKTITGEDKVTAALKYQNYFEFQPQCKLVLATNYLPHAAAGDDAFWRRSKILPFTATVPEQKRIPDLAIKLLRKEGPGILNWALAGFATWQSIGLQEPPEITAAVNDYRSGEDTIREFVDECCELDFDPDSAWRVSRKELYTEYLKWSKESNIRPMSKKRLSLELQRLGVHGDDGDRFWLGLRIRGAFE